MTKGRSVYNFKLNCNRSLIESHLNSFLSGNSFQQVTEKGETYFKSGDSLSGYRYFKYLINEGNLEIVAWVWSAFGDLKVEQTGLTSINIQCNSYMNLLNQLFQDINNINNQNVNSNVSVNINESINNNANIYQEQTTKRNEKLCEIGFWLSILGFIASFSDFIYGILFYIVIFYFASVGLKTRKRNKAIATIVIGCISIVVAVIRIALLLVK